MEYESNALNGRRVGLMQRLTYIGAGKTYGGQTAGYYLTGRQVRHAGEFGTTVSLVKGQEYDESGSGR